MYEDVLIQEVQSNSALNLKYFLCIFKDTVPSADVM
jgi:hypothetical protein